MFRCWLLLLFLSLLAPARTVAAERYAAMFADGSRAEEAEVRDWNEPASTARIGGKMLFDPNVPIRWILDRQQPSASVPAASLEFDGGDRLAGEVIGFSPGRENPYESTLPHLLVKPTAEVQPADVTAPAVLRVTTEWLRRIVWVPVSPLPLQPGTAWLRTGVSVSFRSLRWSPRGITLLTSEGVKELEFSDLAEIHLPERNPWNSYYEQLAHLSPQLKSRLLQLHTTEGSVWTTSTERFQARHHGDRNRPEQWYQLIQPAWSLDSIWLRYRTIRHWRSFAPHEVPLSLILPRKVTHQATFGGMWDYQRDRNVQSGPLRSLDAEFGWGFGVQGTSELEFQYPASARGFRTRFGLDGAVKEGGCVNVEVTVGKQQIVLRHAALIGSAFVGEAVCQALPSGQDEERILSLRTDMAHADRPAGADPFDIRDLLNWYEPELQLDTAALNSEVAARRAARLPGLIGWTISPEDSRSMVVSNTTNAFDSRDPHYRLTARSTDSFYTLSRNLKVGLADRWLVLVASRFPENTSPTAIQIRVDGRVMGEFDVPIRQSMTDPEPMLIPIDRFQGMTVTIELVVYPSDDKSWVDWRGVTLTQERPGLLPLFEDDEKFAPLLNQGMGRFVIDTEQPFSGLRSLKVTPPSAENPSIPGLQAAIFEHPQLGQYRFLLFAWKKQTGTRMQIQFANHRTFGDQGLPPVRDSQSFDVARRRTLIVDERGQRFGYCYEVGAVTAQSPFPLWLHGDLPRDWQLVQRDLYGDFGSMLLTGLSLKAIDGDACWFDHLYLARTNADLEYAVRLLVNPQLEPPKPDQNGFMTIQRREDFPAEFSRIAPLFSAFDMAHGLIRQAEQNGQTDVLRTHANAPDKPLILHAGIVLPADRPMLLNLHVSHPPQCDWQLVVRANGQVLHDQLIDEKLTLPQRGWATIQVDMEKYAGQKVLLEVLNQSNNWQNETAYWKQIALIEK